jgi:hypothetical protein
MPIGAIEHWLVIYGLALLATAGFLVDAWSNAQVATADQWRARTHARAQAIAGVSWLLMCVVALYLGDLAHTRSPLISTRLVPGLTAMGYLYLVGMLVLWYARHRMYRGS